MLCAMSTLPGALAFLATKWGQRSYLNFILNIMEKQWIVNRGVNWPDDVDVLQISFWSLFF